MVSQPDGNNTAYITFPTYAAKMPKTFNNFSLHSILMRVFICSCNSTFIPCTKLPKLLSQDVVTKWKWNWFCLRLCLCVSFQGYTGSSQAYETMRLKYWRRNIIPKHQLITSDRPRTIYYMNKIAWISIHYGLIMTTPNWPTGQNYAWPTQINQ